VVVRFRAVAEREGDALRIDVPAPRGSGTSQGTALSLRWPHGATFGEAWSPTHRTAVNAAGRMREARVDDAVGTVTLLLPVRESRGAAMSVLTHAPARGEGYALITLTPPARAAGNTPRDVTFVIDVSGSMSGAKMEQARAAGRQLLNTLGRDDRFRLIAFANDVDEFRPRWTAATVTERRAAEEWLDGLSAAGGTNIGGALERALEASTPANRLGLVLFLTDGAPTVGERRAERLAARAAELREARRIFTFGLGADVKVALLEELALDGAGTAHFVRPEEDVERVVGVVAQRITRPVATDVRIRADGVTLHAVQPHGTIDLFAGQELTVLARYRGANGRARVIITGQSADGPVRWESTVDFPARRSSDAFVGRLWATQRVGWLSAERRRNGASQEVDAEIRALGERWGIPTELTSYLVLEPGMVLPSHRDAQRQRLTDSPNAVSSSAPAGPPPGAGRSEFEQAKTAAEMRGARSVAASSDADNSAVTRRTANRVFVLRDSVWTDTRAAAASARKVSVQPYSRAYFALIEQVPELREILAIGDRVVVHGRAVTLELSARGVEALDGAALTAFTRDW
jgi:Ca-activated chloride channel family protein